MSVQYINLENRLFYRLVKVTYIFLFYVSCLIGFSTVLLVGNLSSAVYGMLFIPISYVLLNIAKDTLIYIAFGEKIFFKWVRDIFDNIFRLFEKAKLISKSYNSISTDPQGVAAQVVMMLLDKKSPFCYSEDELNNTLQFTAKCASVGYSLYIYLLLIRNKFGQEISSTVKHHLIILFNKIEENIYYHFLDIFHMVEFLLESSNLAEVNLLINDNLVAEYKLAHYFLVTWPSSPYYLPDEKRLNITYEEIEKHCGQDCVYTICEYLVNNKKEAINSFKHFINLIKFKPETVRGLEIYEEIAWSKNPGCFENHLKRKFNNPIFSLSKRVISQAQVDQAREKDIEEAAAIKKDIELLIDTLGNIEDKTFNFDDLNKLRTRVYDLILRVFEVGGKVVLDDLPMLAEIKANIIEDYKSIIKEHKDLFKNTDEQSIDDAEQAIGKLHNVFIAQYCRKDSPIRISGEFYESLLSEDIYNIKAWLQFANEIKDKKTLEKLNNELNKQINKIVKVTIARGENVPMLEEKLNILGVVV